MTTLNPGCIELIIGPMFSGKSSQLLRRIRRYEHANKKCMVINYYKDNRYTKDQSMTTHDKIMYKATKTENLLKVQATEFDVVAIDEGQFFPQIVEFSEDLANKGKIVIVAALDGTFQRKPFGNIANLLPLAESVEKLSAVCVYCFQEAFFTLRTSKQKELQIVGGSQMYSPVCRRCYFTKNNQKI